MLVVTSMGLAACLSTRQSVTVAGIMTLIELGGLVLIILAGCGSGSGIVTRLPEILPAPDDLSVWLVLSGTTLLAVFALIGLEHPIKVAEEKMNSSRTLPWALFLTLRLTAPVYALVVWVAVIATLNGVIVHVIMNSRVLCGLAAQGNLPKALAHLNPTTDTPLLATAIGISAILVLALAVPLSGLDDLTVRFALVVFAIFNIALISIKSREAAAPLHGFGYTGWVPVAGLVTSFGWLFLDMVVR